MINSVSFKTILITAIVIIISLASNRMNANEFEPRDRDFIICNTSFGYFIEFCEFEDEVEPEIPEHKDPARNPGDEKPKDGINCVRFPNKCSGRERGR